ncbi:MAG: hypothetical protein WCP32_10420 [Bacteroidota bacterium]
MEKPEIEKLTSKITATKRWKRAEDDYMSLYLDEMLPPQLRMGQPMSNMAFIKELQRILLDFPEYYPVYFDLGSRLLSVNIDKATEILDIAYEICLKVSSLEVLKKDFDIAFDNIEKTFHVEFVVRYALKLIEKFPDNALFYDYASTAFATLNQSEKAVEYGLKAVELAPKNTYFLNNLGLTCLAITNYYDAEKYFKLAIKADPKHAFPKNNLANCKIMNAANLSLKEFYLQPADYKKINKLKTDNNNDELDQYIGLMNAYKMLVLRETLSEKYQFKAHNYHSLISALKVFFGFVKTISNDEFLWEDIDFLSGYFKPIMHKFIFKHSDADDEVLNEIYDSTILYYSFLADNKIIDNKQFNSFKKYVISLKDEMFDKMRKYNKIRHNPAVSDTKKEKIREKLFEGDHAWMFIN